MRARDAADRAAQKASRREKKLARKERLRARADGEEGGDAGVQLGPTSAYAGLSEGMLCSITKSVATFVKGAGGIASVKRSSRMHS